MSSAPEFVEVEVAVGREQDLAETFVTLADILIGEYDMHGFAQTLVDQCADLVGAAAVGVLVVDAEGELQLAAASTEEMAELELFELQQHEGPCYEAFVSGLQKREDDLARARQRWPRFARRATELGLKSVQGFPLRVRGERLGALNVFFREPGPFSDADLHALQALADLAAIGISQRHLVSRRREIHEQALARLGQVALMDTPIEHVLDEVCTTVSEVVDAPVCQIYELTSADQLIPRAATATHLGFETIGRTEDSQASYTLRRDRSVVVDRLADDDRFEDPRLRDLGIVSGISTVIPGEPRPFGVLSVHDQVVRAFDREDVTFLEGVATLLASVIARQQTEMHLRRAQKLDAVGQLATGIAHDFNNLLQIIHGNAELLRDERHSDHLDAILQASDQAKRLVAQLLTFGRQSEATTSAVDLNATVTSIADMIGRIIGPNISMDLDLDDSLPSIAADPSQLEQAIVNLMVNARDAMPTGGTITITTRRSPADMLDPELRACVRLVVSDTGSGMSEEVLSRALEPFFTTKEPERGSGMGLATVYGTVTAAQGRINLDSAPGHGTTVTIDWPCSESVATSETLAQTAVMDAQSGCILVVDDEPDIRTLVAAALTRTGYEVLTAANASEALEQLDSGASVDLLLTDVVMPGMDGPELARTVRDQQPSVRILYMSGHAPTSTNLDDGVGFLEKPFTLVALLQLVQRALGTSPRS